MLNSCLEPIYYIWYIYIYYSSIVHLEQRVCVVFLPFVEKWHCPAVRWRARAFAYADLVFPQFNLHNSPVPVPMENMRGRFSVSTGSQRPRRWRFPRATTRKIYLMRSLHVCVCACSTCTI